MIIRNKCAHGFHIAKIIVCLDIADYYLLFFVEKLSHSLEVGIVWRARERNDVNNSDIFLPK